MADFRKTLQRTDTTNKFFKGVEAGTYLLSIQASSGHYCTPRENHKSAEMYVSFELLINDDNDEYCNPFTDGNIISFDRYDELMIHVQGREDSTVCTFNWLHWDIIQDLIEHLEWKTKSKKTTETKLVIEITSPVWKDSLIEEPILILTLAVGSYNARVDRSPYSTGFDDWKAYLKAFIDTNELAFSNAKLSEYAEDRNTLRDFFEKGFGGSHFWMYDLQGERAVLIYAIEKPTE